MIVINKSDASDELTQGPLRCHTGTYLPRGDPQSVRGEAMVTNQASPGASPVVDFRLFITSKTNANPHFRAMSRRSLDTLLLRGALRLLTLLKNSTQQQLP